jgi:hypothetical protein
LASTLELLYFSSHLFCFYYLGVFLFLVFDLVGRAITQNFPRFEECAENIIDWLGFVLPDVGIKIKYLLKIPSQNNVPFSFWQTL